MAKITFGVIREAREELQQLRSEIKEFTKKGQTIMNIWPEYDLTEREDSSGLMFAHLDTYYRFQFEGKWYLYRQNFKCYSSEGINGSVEGVIKNATRSINIIAEHGDSSYMRISERTILDPNQQPE
ncbi:hypothetical protein [Dyadobacter sp. CY312]|uniref:hypothetical protein n=1 Tax=Dyadobacter sp. CY312 TaxID=2907303 RepID=UPI001F466D38|nr:hypothetical protein [Dyadobacter sp. CY312]MCE7039198.1 hypothetical protein [Dyadobacter sp. CY312]